jgi:hypothetical protein
MQVQVLLLEHHHHHHPNWQYHPAATLLPSSSNVHPQRTALLEPRCRRSNRRCLKGGGGL